LGQTFTITSFDSGSFLCSANKFSIQNAGDTGYTEILTDSILLSVNTVPVDTTKAFKDIKGPMSVPWTLKEMLLIYRCYCLQHYLVYNLFYP